MMTSPRRRMVLALPCSLSLALTAGCHQQRPDAQVTQAPSTPAPLAAAAPAPAATPAAPKPQPGCAAPLAQGPATPVKVGNLDAVREGTQLTFSARQPDGDLALGVLGPINEDTGENLLGLQSYMKYFRQQQVDAIVVTGDSGETPRSIQRVLSELAQTGLPVFVVVGNSECAADYVEGVTAAQKAHSNIVNLNEVRVVQFPEATLVSLPGHHDPNFMHCDKGCLYSSATVNEVVTAAKAAKSPVVLVSHGPPQQEGTQAVDFTPNAGGNVGNPDIRRAVQEANIHFGLFSNIKEAGARATDASGSTVVPPDTDVASLFLNPGPASTDAWKMNDGQTSHGFAAVFHLGPKGARWSLYRHPAFTKQERAKAHKLDPATTSAAESR